MKRDFEFTRRDERETLVKIPKDGSLKNDRKIP